MNKNKQILLANFIRSARDRKKARFDDQQILFNKQTAKIPF